MRVEIEALPPEEWSQNWKGSFIDRYRAGRQYQQLVFYSLVSARNLAKRQKQGWAPFEKAVLDLLLIFPERRERDEDNLRARFKPGQDALVQAEYIKTDTQQHLILGPIVVLVDPDRAPMTIIDIREAGDE